MERLDIWTVLCLKTNNRDRGDEAAANSLTETHYNIIEFCLSGPFLLIELAWLSDQDNSEVKTVNKTGSQRARVSRHGMARTVTRYGRVGGHADKKTQYNSPRFYLRHRQLQPLQSYLSCRPSGVKPGVIMSD